MSTLLSGHLSPFSTTGLSTGLYTKDRQQSCRSFAMYPRKYRLAMVLSMLLAWSLRASNMLEVMRGRLSPTQTKSQSKCQ